MLKFFTPRSVIFICLIICLFASTDNHWGKEKWRKTIEADAKGYYAYLPAVFIYQDLNFGFFDSIDKNKYCIPYLLYDYRIKLFNGKLIDKYFCGTSVAQLPFFLMAHVTSYLKGYPRDGYSKFYMFFIALAALFYLFVGLFYIDKLLQLYYIKSHIRSFAIISIVFGTNLFFYSVYEAGMSHIYSFAFISMFCYFAKKYFNNYQGRLLVFCIALLGLIFIIRPVNVLVIFSIPFLAGNKANFLTGIKSLKTNAAACISGILIMMAIISIQSIIYKISTGHFWVYSYQTEVFHFDQPHYIDILFSYKKGLFLYTPMYLISLFGIYFLYRKRKFEFFTFVFFFLLITHVLSSWWSWWYGGSFSSRVYVEYLPLFAVLLAIFFHNIQNKVFKSITTLIIILTIALCQFQTYQYRYFYIHWEDMTKEKYWDTFLKLKKEI